jgi:hypothetical protein
LTGIAVTISDSGCLVYPEFREETVALELKSGVNEAEQQIGEAI